MRYIFSIFKMHTKITNESEMKKLMSHQPQFSENVYGAPHIWSTLYYSGRNIKKTTITIFTTYSANCCFNGEDHCGGPVQIC